MNIGVYAIVLSVGLCLSNETLAMCRALRQLQGNSEQFLKIHTHQRRSFFDIKDLDKIAWLDADEANSKAQSAHVAIRKIDSRLTETNKRLVALERTVAEQKKILQEIEDMLKAKR